jgi:hypothetical protein
MTRRGLALVAVVEEEQEETQKKVEREIVRGPTSPVS